MRLRAWGEVGPGYGVATFSCRGCAYRRAVGTDARSLGGTSLSAGAGWAPSRFLRLGFVDDGWLNGVKKHDSLPTLDYFNLVASYSVRGGPGPFVELGWGVVRYGLQFGTGSFFDPVDAKKNPFAVGWGHNYRFGVGWSGKGFAAHVTYLPGWQRTLWAADSGAVATRWKERMIFLVVSARTGAYRSRDPE